jgi:uncharacterized protein (DUF488 family)
VTSAAKPRPTQAAKLTLLTIGHSTHSLDELTYMLKAHNVGRIVDVRSVPRSRHVPHFNRETLASKLRARGIRYVHLKSLGGRRHPDKNSVNTGWRNSSFRGYADYMATPQFRQGLERLLRLARTHRSAIMCAEAVPWRCHRSLIADALLVRRVNVEHILSATKRQEHSLTPFANVDGLEIAYPSEGTQKAKGTQKLFET